MADNPMKAKLEDMFNNIKESWTRDTDKVEYYIALNDMLKEICTKDSIEEYFSNDEAVITYFTGEFIKESVGYILKAFTLYGQNGDEIGLEVLKNVYNLFLKFHKNKKYNEIFELIRSVFNNDSLKHNFFETSYRDDKDSIKKYDVLHRRSRIDRLIFFIENPEGCFEENLMEERPGDKYIMLKNQMKRRKNRFENIIREIKLNQKKSEYLMKKYIFDLLSRKKSVYKG